MDIRNDWKYHWIDKKFPFKIKDKSGKYDDKVAVKKEHYKVQFMHVQYQLEYFEAKTEGNYLSEINVCKIRLERILDDHSEWLV